MNEFFDEYGWLCISVIGGVLSLSFFLGHVTGSHSLLKPMIDAVLGGLM